MRILNGTLAAWTAAGKPLESGETKAGAGDVTLSPGHLPVFTADEAAGFTSDGAILLDAAGNVTEGLGSNVFLVDRGTLLEGDRVRRRGRQRSR